MSVLLAIDPGKTSNLGFALFFDGILFKCGVLRQAKLPVSQQLTRRTDPASPDATNVARRALVETLVHAHVQQARVSDVVVEQMQVYSGQRSSVPTDLIDVTFTAGLVAGAFPDAGLRCVTAATWKGSVPDEACWRKIRKALSPEELDVAARHQCLDAETSKHFHHGLEAIGIGLWALWRL